MCEFTKGSKFIGKGAFTKAYLHSDNKVILISRDPVKEAMSLGGFPKSSLFPTIRLDSGVYKTKYYPKESVTTLKGIHRKYYECLRDLYNNNACYGYESTYKLFQRIKYKYLRETLIDALNSINNETANFEFTPRNIRVSNGKLILLDCFFLTSEL